MSLDRVVLGYVAVPWPGEAEGELIAAPFADGPVLAQATVNGALQPDGTLSVTLYWQTTQTPSANYTIFVHLLDEDGQFLTGADGVPFAGRFPSRGWHPGLTIPSSHDLHVPPELVAGNYQINVGLYLPATGARLQRLDGDGNPTDEQAVTLAQLQYPANGGE